MVKIHLHFSGTKISFLGKSFKSIPIWCQKQGIKFVKCIWAINPSGMRDMETGVAPFKPAGPCVFSEVLISILKASSPTV